MIREYAWKWTCLLWPLWLVALIALYAVVAGDSTVTYCDVDIF